MAGSYKSELSDRQSVQSFINGISQSSQRYRRNIETIFSKYDRPCVKDDIIDLSTLSLSRNYGRLMRNHRNVVGKANLKSTKHKEELSLKQMQSQNPENLNVSRAIARKCVSILETSRRLEEDDVSDAESIGSENSDEDDDEEEEKKEDACKSCSSEEESEVGAFNSEEDNENDVENYWDYQEEDVEVYIDEDNCKDEVGGEIGEKENKLPSDETRCKSGWFVKGRSQKERKNSNHAHNGVDLSDITSSKDFQDDFEQLTKHSRGRKGAKVSPEHKNIIQNHKMSRGHLSLSPKGSSNLTQGLPLLTADRNLSKKKNSREEKHSFISYGDTLCDDDKVRSIRKENSIEPCAGANITSATFNISVSGKPALKVLDISAIQDDSFSNENLSFVSVSSPGKIAFKPKTVGGPQKSLGDTYAIDDTISICQQKTSSSADLGKTRNCSPKSQCGHTSQNHFQPSPNPTKTDDRIDFLKTKYPTSLREESKSVSSALSVCSGPTSVSDAVFKSPQGVAIRRIRPMQLTSDVSATSPNTCLSDAKNDHRLVSPAKSLKSSLQAAQMWGKCDSIISSLSASSATNLAQSSEQYGDDDDNTNTWSEPDANQNKKMASFQAEGLEANTLGETDAEAKTHNNMSFTSNDESERPWSRAYELAMKSPAKRKNNPHGYVEKPLISSQNKHGNLGCYVQTDCSTPSPPCSDQLNVSLTSSFQNMDLRRAYSVDRHHKLSRMNSLNQVKAKSRSPRCALPNGLQNVDGKAVTCKDSTFTQLTPSLPSKFVNEQTPSPAFPSGTERKSHARQKVAGFDLQQWRSSETLHPRAPGTSFMKRKIPASFTSGYCSQTSPSLWETGQNSKAFSSTTVFSKARNKESAGNLNQDKYCPKNNQTSSQRSHSDFTVTKFHPLSASSFVFGSKFGDSEAVDFKDVQSGDSFQQSSIWGRTKSSALGKSKLGSVANEACGIKYSEPKSIPQPPTEAISINPFLLSKQDKLSVPAATPLAINKANSHVLRWLEASSKHYNPPQSIHHPSSSCNFLAQSKSVSSKERKSYDAELETNIRGFSVQPVFGSFQEKRDVGVQVQLDIGQLSSFSRPGMSSMFDGYSCHCKHQHRSHCLCHSSKHISCWPAVPEPLPPQPITPQHHFFAGNMKATNTQSCFSKPLSTPQKSFSVSQSSLNKRALAVWRQIQAEKSVSQLSPSDFSVIGSDTSLSPSTSFGDQQSRGGDEEGNQFADDEEAVDETLMDQESRRPKSQDLSKLFDGNRGSRSFVETQNARIKSHASIKKQDSSTSTSPVKTQQACQNTMFPLSYINQFSPDNPNRRDSDMALYQYEQQLLASAPSYRSMLKTFKPRRNQHQAGAVPSSASRTKSKPTFPELVEDVVVERPSKFRKLSHSSPSNTKLTSPEYHRGLIKSPCNNHSSPIQKKECSSFKSPKSRPAVTNVVHCKNSSPPVHCVAKARVSTPVKKALTMPDFGLDETISTIISPTASKENHNITVLNSTPMPQDYVQCLESSDSDSDNEVSLL